MIRSTGDSFGPSHFGNFWNVLKIYIFRCVCISSTYPRQLVGLLLTNTFRFPLHRYLCWTITECQCSWPRDVIYFLKALTNIFKIFLGGSKKDVKEGGASKNILPPNKLNFFSVLEWSNQTNLYFSIGFSIFSSFIQLFSNWSWRGVYWSKTFSTRNTRLMHLPGFASFLWLSFYFYAWMKIEYNKYNTWLHVVGPKITSFLW